MNQHMQRDFRFGGRPDIEVWQESVLNIFQCTARKIACKGDLLDGTVASPEASIFGIDGVIKMNQHMQRDFRVGGRPDIEVWQESVLNIIQCTARKIACKGDLLDGTVA